MSAILGLMEKRSKVVRKGPCPACQEVGHDRSGDNLVYYDDGFAYCYACKYHLTSINPHDTLSYNSILSNYYNDNNKGITNNMTTEYLPWRGVTVNTMKKYGVKTRVLPDGKPYQIVYPYQTFSKTRLLDSKEFKSEGLAIEAQLFGQDKFSSGCAQSVTLTEGELDCLSVFQMLGSKWPAVSVRSSGSAVADCTRSFEWLNSFDRIYIAFDNDDAGQKAAKEVARLFDVNKVFHVKLSKHKDANDYLRASDDREFTQVWWNSRPYAPKGIINMYDDISAILDKADTASAATYPFTVLNDLTYGIRLGEVVLFTAQEKVGKTEVLRAIEYHLLMTTDHNIGIIHLEEQEKRSVLGLIGYHLNVPAHLPDTPLSKDDAFKAFKDITRKDGRLSLYSHFGTDDCDSIIDIIRHLAAVRNCKFIFLDHISMLVSGLEGDDERRKLDYIATKLAMLTRELGFTLFLISHVNDEGKTRGSRYISKIADLIVSLKRDIEAEKVEDRNKTYLSVRGNRYAGSSGPAGVLWFDPTTFKLEEMNAANNNEEWTRAAGF